MPENVTDRVRAREELECGCVIVEFEPPSGASFTYAYAEKTCENHTDNEVLVNYTIKTSSPQYYTLAAGSEDDDG